MPPDLVQNIVGQFVADGVASINVIGPAVLGLAMSMYLFLQILRFFSRRFAKKDFHISPVTRGRKKTFDFAVRRFEDQTLDDAEVPNISPHFDDRNVDAWTEVGLFIKGWEDIGGYVYERDPKQILDDDEADPYDDPKRFLYDEPEEV